MELRGRPEALAFDVYGTLLDVSAMGASMGAQGLDGPELAAAWRRHQLEISWLLSLAGRYEDFAAVSRYALDAALAEAGVAVPARVRQEALAALAELPAHADAAPALERLAAAGRRLAVLSNGSPGMLEDVLAAAGLRDALEHVVSADEVGVYKPSPLLYEHGARRLGLAPASVWLVSANPFDCAGAKLAGLGVAKVERASTLAYGFAPPPDLVVPTLADLADRLA